MSLGLNFFLLRILVELCHLLHDVTTVLFHRLVDMHWANNDEQLFSYSQQLYNTVLYNPHCCLSKQKEFTAFGAVS